MLTAILIALIIYILVVTRWPVRVPHPGVQATVDLLKAADLKDAEVMRMASEYVRYCDARNHPHTVEDPHARRLEKLASRYETVNRVPLNFKVYRTPDINAFATADGSIRLFSGLMDAMDDDELMAIIGHEMGHIRNSDSLGAMRKALLGSAARGILSAAGGTLGSLSGGQLGSLAEKYAGARFSQQQEFRADDFSFGFLVRNGYDPRAMARALEKLHTLSKKGDVPGAGLMQLFSTHPDTLLRTKRMQARAEAHAKRLAGS